MKALSKKYKKLPPEKQVNYQIIVHVFKTMLCMHMEDSFSVLEVVAKPQMFWIEIVITGIESVV